MIKAPFPWFGGKSKVAPIVWQAFGEIRNYVEPFFGSGAVLLGADYSPSRIETINDLDGFVANFWRATQHDPDAVAQWADSPVNECDLHAKHLWLVDRMNDLSARLMADPEYYDVRVAGYWVWGMCAWIGSGFCSGRGPWRNVDGKLTRCDGGGINRQLPHLGNAGQGINRQLPHLGNAGRGAFIHDYFREIRDRMRDVRVCCGDWSRVCGPSVVSKIGEFGLFLDPPYFSDRGDVYRTDETLHDKSMRDRVVATALEYGAHPKGRVIVCGYNGEYPELEAEGWQVFAWKTKGGLTGRGGGNAQENSKRERMWLSPRCHRVGSSQIAIADIDG